mmetsp:Transcript_24575/g.48368  ORF Transcript_24575/g.48368 Transcript_24575/m.48368 type:complete len:251 (-) Transcript_24575:1188-1940(-)
MGVQLRPHIFCLLLTLLQDRVDIGICDSAIVSVASSQHTVGAVPNHLHHIIFTHFVVFVQFPALNDHSIQPQFYLCFLQNLLFDAVLRHKPKDLHLLLLPDSVGAVLGLEVHLRVPVGVVQNHNVCRGQVDAQPARSRGQQEHKLLRPFSIERVHHLLPSLRRCASINAAVRQLAVDTVVLQDVQSASHLREDQNSAVLSSQPRQQLVKHQHLATVEDQMLIVRRQAPVFDAFEQVRVVSSFAQLHHNIE